jgi:hypothetical protein
VVSTKSSVFKQIVRHYSVDYSVVAVSSVASLTGYGRRHAKMVV